MLPAARQWSAHVESMESVVLAGLATAVPAPTSVFMVGKAKDGPMPRGGSAFAVGAEPNQVRRRPAVVRKRLPQDGVSRREAVEP
jgi:hypothetical protein